MGDAEDNEMMRLELVGLLALSAGACGSSSLGGPDGGGGAGGSGACQAVLALDRSCTSSNDCIAVSHTTNCCGQEQVFGLRASEQARFTMLEAQCDPTYPACGCAAQQPFADDGSPLRFQQTAGVTCVQGQCTTFVPECGAPCATGTTCFSCTNHGSTFAACTTPCAGSGECHDPALPLCQSGSTGNTYGMFCTASNVACDTQ
jgi:hypothetical protein